MSLTSLSSIELEGVFPMVRKLVCCMMLAIYPASLMAADTNAAMLHAKGTTWLNGAPTPASAAVFSGDLVQTDANSAAQITDTGSSVSVLPGSLIKFEGKALGLSHGSVTVATSRKFSARVGTLTVAPTSDAWTEFQVNESEGKVQIVARKGDVSVSDGAGSSTIAGGQQTTRYASSDRRKDGAAPAGGGGVLDSPWVMGVGGAAIGALVTWALMQGSNPVSKSVP